MLHEIQLKVGDYVVKNNHGIFGSNTGAKDYSSRTPVLKIEKVTHDSGPENKRMIRINKKYTISEYSVSVVSQERAEEILAIYESCKEINESLKPDLNTSCFREDNGQPKVAVDPLGARQLLFQFKMKNPEGGYQIYKCSHCGNLHLGKTRNIVQDIILL
jgi:hypothetical protein